MRQTGDPLDTEGCQESASLRGSASPRLSHLPLLHANGGSARASSLSWMGSLWESLDPFGLPSICVSKSEIPELPQGAAKSPN